MVKDDSLKRKKSLSTGMKEDLGICTLRLNEKALDPQTV